MTDRPSHAEPGASPTPAARDEVAAYLDAALHAGASSQDIATTVTAAFEGIAQALTPVIGQRGMAALFKRTVYLTGKAQPFLAVALQGLPADLDMAMLAPTLGQQSAADAAATGAALLQTFHQLLSSLIGLSLTERLLRPVWATFMSGPSAAHRTP